MGITVNIRHEGKTVSFRIISEGRGFMEARRRFGNLDVCPLCKERISPKVARVWLVISNQVGVPNRILHDECMQEKTPEYAFRLIAEDYKEAQRYRDWFPKDS
jgi:hypothetical protein